MEKKAQKTTESEYILIPNPIYDVVFKYLMEDYESAVIVLSTFIGQKITDLHFEPQEFPDKTEEDNDGEHIKLFHLDFSATITRADGTNEIIIIELQKAKRPSDIFRFKRYLSKNFQRKFKKTVIDERTGAIKEIEVSYRIFPIYIFNFKIENEIKDLVITVNRHKTGLFKRMELKKESEFIENISYDMLIVQLPYINDVTPEDYKDDEYREKLYYFLKLFDQATKTENEHRLCIKRQIYPAYFKPVILRLQCAFSEIFNLDEKMYVEEEYLRELEEMSNQICYYKLKIEEQEKQIQ